MARALDHIYFGEPPGVVFTAAVEALRDTGARIETVDSHNMRIVATKGMSLRSYGETITVQVSPVNSNLTEVTVLSKARFPFQVADSGKNTKNIERFETALRRHLPRV